MRAFITRPGANHNRGAVGTRRRVHLQMREMIVHLIAAVRSGASRNGSTHLSDMTVVSVGMELQIEPAEAVLRRNIRAA